MINYNQIITENSVLESAHYAGKGEEWNGD